MTRHQIIPTLFDVAEWRLNGEAEKQAFVPQGATDPAAAMAPDPMAAAPPMGGDPMAAMAGGMPPAAPAAGPMAAPPGAAPAGAAPAAGAQGAGKPKLDPAFIYQELARVRKLLTHLMKNQGIDMPPDILDDGAVAMVSQGMTPQSAPIGQGGQAEQGAAGLPGIGGQGPLNPLEPPGGAGGAGGTEKPASDVMQLFRAPPKHARPDFDNARNRIDALSALSRSLTQK